MRHWMYSLARALRLELFSLFRGWTIWALVLLPSVAAGVRLLIFKATTLGQLEQDGAAVTGFGFMVDGIIVGLVILYILLVVHASLAFAATRDQGSIRHLVVRSVSRQAFVLSQFIWALGLAILSALLAVGLAVALSASLWELGPVVEDGYEIIAVQDIVPEIRTGLLLGLLPIPALLAAGLLISVCASSAIRALVSALVLVLGFDILKGVLGQFAHYIALSFLPAINDSSYLRDVAAIARGYSDVLIDEQVFQLNLWIPIPQALVLLMAALWVANRKTL